jgi:hypothetical protein
MVMKMQDEKLLNCDLNYQLFLMDLLHTFLACWNLSALFLQVDYKCMQIILYVFHVRDKQNHENEDLIRRNTKILLMLKEIVILSLYEKNYFNDFATHNSNIIHLKNKMTETQKKNKE